MCYRCAASNQSPKTSPEDASSPPLPSSSKELPEAKNDGMVDYEIISFLEQSNSQINDPAVIQVPASSCNETITKIEEEQQQEPQPNQQLECTVTVVPVRKISPPMNISPPSSEEDEEQQNEPPPLIEDDDNKQPQLSELEERLINNMKNIFCDGMGQIHEEEPRRYVLPANHFSDSSNDDLKIDENTNGTFQFFLNLLLFNNDTFFIALAGLASASTVPLPQSPFFQLDPDDERGASSSVMTAEDSSNTDGEAALAGAANIITIREVTDNAGVSAVEMTEHFDDGGASNNIPITTAAVPNSSAAERNDISSAIVGVKRRRKQQMPVHAQLEEKRCRGACGSSSKCLSTRDSQDQLLRCTNYYERTKCPLWVGPNCAETFHSYKCRICTVIDSTRLSRYYCSSFFILLLIILLLIIL